MPKKNAPAILVATILIFVARALEFQSENDLFSSAFVAGVFGVITSVVDYFATRLGKSQGAPGVSAQWAPYLLFGWIISLIIVILDILSNTFLHTKTFSEWLSGIVSGVIAYSVLAVIGTFAKAHKYDHKAINLPVAYALVAVLLNSVMLYFFIFA
jgi:hypothetical protein